MASDLGTRNDTFLDYMPMHSWNFCIRALLKMGAPKASDGHSQDKKKLGGRGDFDAVICTST
jgi:hypothetical protein